MYIYEKGEEYIKMCVIKKRKDFSFMFIFFYIKKKIIRR